MKKKGLIVVFFFGGIMVTSGFGLSSMMSPPPEDNPEFTITGTPADNFPDEQRAQFCGSGDAKSTDYIREFSIPTPCTNPLAVVTDYDGNVWFTQTNTGKLAKFDPTTERFTEYDNPLWPPGARSMMWGIDYAPDGSVWFTDEAFDSVWKFSTIDEKYERIGYPSEGNSLPQKLKIYGSQIIINDFTGNKLTLLDANPSAGEINYLSIPSPVDNSVTADFAVDANDNIWFTNWLFQQGGVLVKFNQNGYLDSVANSNEQFLPLLDFVEVYALPPELLTPNGAVVTNDGTIWLADTTTSFFFNFDPFTEQFTHYVTADPLPSTYGDQSGDITSVPGSRPYWIEADEQGRLVFNEQAANNISVMDPKLQSLVEYQIPSKNPNWGDCDPGTGMMLADCGIAQIFDFAIDGEKIWFTEWVENNIGVVDTSVPLPIEIQLESDTLTLAPGETQEFNFTVFPKSQNDMDVSLVLSPTHDFLNVDLVNDTPQTFQLNSDVPRPIHTTISASEDAVAGTYKILLGVQSPDIAISKYVTVTIE